MSDWEALAETVTRNRAWTGKRLDGAPVWDYCVVTASTPQQAALYRWELQSRREGGHLPLSPTRYLAVADPPGPRIGSGGGLLWALQAVAHDLRRRAPAAARRGGAALQLPRRRILIIQSGGDSRRVPLHTATGKLFAPVPALLAGARVSTTFDELWAVVGRLAGLLDGGVVVAAGDVLLAFDASSVTPAADGLTTIACHGDLQTGSQHGVYARDAAGHPTAFLQKASPGRLRRAGAVDVEGRVAIDSGIMVFTGAAARALEEASQPAKGGAPGLVAIARELGVPLDLYTHYVAGLSPSLVTEAQRPVDQAMTAAVAEALGPLALKVTVPEPSLFVHLGTTRQLREHLTRTSEVRRVFGFGRAPQSVTGDAPVAPSAVVVRSLLTHPESRVEPGAVLVDVRGRGGLTVGRGAIVGRVELGEGELAVPADTVLDTLPVVVRGPGRQRRRGWVALAYGVEDDPRAAVSAPSTTFLGAPLQEWLRAAGVPEGELWEAADPAERTLWKARLFPCAVEGSEAAVALVRWMLEPGPISRRAVREWVRSRRLAFADLAAALDAPQLIRRHTELLRAIATRLATDDLGACGDLPLAPLVSGLPDRAAAGTVEDLAGYAGAARPPLERCRALACLADVAKEMERRAATKENAAVRRALRSAANKGSGATPSQVHTELHRQAFRAVAEAVRRSVPLPPQRRLGIGEGRRVVVEAPVRVDLAGGWTDTPPYCLEHGGTVLNVAVNLNGKPPVQVTARPLAEPVVRLRVGAAERQAEFRHLRPLCAYARPGDDTAIPKAALFCSGILREDASVSLREQLERFGRGVELAFRCDVPIGSGLGSSSILGAAILAALAGLCGRNPTPAELFEEVLQLEQMLTTGGGWQDQVGGVTGGIKMTTSKPGSPQELRARRVKLSAPVADELHRRMLLYHTGYTRVAKDILESVMGRYIAREPAVVAALGELKGLARLAERGLRSGGLDDVGVAMSEQWRRNKVLDPDSTNPKIDALFEALTPLVCGAKLAGAGGGGFLAVMRWGPDGSPSAERIVRVLARMAPEGRPYAFEINDRGLQLRVE